MKKGIIILILLVVVVAIYFFVIKKDNAPEETEEIKETEKQPEISKTTIQKVVEKINKIPIETPQKVQLIKTALQNIAVENRIKIATPNTINSLKFAEAMGK